MTDRGSYRAIYTALVDGPDFQAFSPGAKLVFYTLKMTLGPSGIDVVPALVATLVERTGAETAHVEKALKQLEDAGWVQRERNVVWIVAGLEHEPALNIRKNANHRTKVARHLNDLPRLAIVDAFRDRYGFAAPPVEMPSTAAETEAENGLKMPSMIPSKMPSNLPSISKEEGKGKREKGNNTRLAPKGAGGRPTWLTPFADGWRARYGGEMSAGRAVKALARLVELHGADETLRRWLIYLGQTAAEYANAPRFAETWGRWERTVLVITADERPRVPSATEMIL